MFSFLCMLLLMGGGEKEIALPQPSLDGTYPLEKALHLRRSVRSFSDEDLTIPQLSQILWAAQGITDSLHTRTLRTAPSAGALYPLEIYVVMKEGTYHYLPEEHKLVRIKKGDLRKDLSNAALSQTAIATAAVDIVLAAVYERTTGKYSDRGIRYVHIEIGHAGQNILLQAVALGLGAVPIGAFYDDKVGEVVGCSSEEIPLYIIPIGVPN